LSHSPALDILYINKIARLQSVYFINDYVYNSE
jgi:hypothetical protein